MEKRRGLPDGLRFFTDFIVKIYKKLILLQPVEYQKREITVLNYYPKISYGAFVEAERIYRKTEDLIKVDKFLVLSLQQQEKLKNLSVRPTIT